jgi:hypothetical protein
MINLLSSLVFFLYVVIIELIKEFTSYCMKTLQDIYDAFVTKKEQGTLLISS